MVIFFSLSDVWCEAIRSKKQGGVDEHVGHKGVFKSKQYTVVQSCFRKEDENVILKALNFEVSGSRGRLKQMWKKQVENEMKKNGLGKEDACDRTKWRGRVKTMTI